MPSKKMRSSDAQLLDISQVVYKVSEQEEKRVQDEKETIDRWNLFVKNEKLLARGFEPERRETRVSQFTNLIISAMLHL